MDSRILARLDFTLLWLALTLSILGVVGVYSASSFDPESSLYFKQTLRVCLGLLICVVLLSIDYHFLVDHAFFLYGISLSVLIGVLIFGSEINGSKSWISIAGMNLQPSELTKIVMILVAARYLADLNERYLKTRQLLTLGTISAIPVALIVLQRDLGTALMYLPIVGGVAWVAGIKPKTILVCFLLILLISPVIWFGLKDYQKQRVLVTFDPELDPQGIGYQARQSRIAIGSGGVFGRGIGNGLQSQLGFVPESHTDFIFALLAEETGFIGATVILALYLLLLLRLIDIAQKARDRTGMLILVGIVWMIFSHVLINVGMALGILPAIGIPLPLLSYGGSSLMTVFAAIGLGLNVGLRRFVYS